MTSEVTVPQDVAEATIQGEKMSDQLKQLLDDVKKQGVTLETLGTTLAEVNAAEPGTEWEGNSNDGRPVKLIKNQNTPDGEESYNFQI